MERIRQAVEQARKQRQESPDAALPSRTDSAGTGQAEAAPVTKIVYTETKTVTVSPAVRERNRLVAAIPGHPLQDTYRMLRTQVLQEMHANNWKTVGVTSPMAGSGKTLTAINLAISIGMDMSHTALLFDADLRSSSVAAYFDFKPEYGVNDYLSNDVPLTKVLFHPDMDRLIVLPCGGRIDESAETLASPKFIALLQEVRDRYSDRITVVDLAPALDVDDALAIAPHVDCILMVAESGETRHEDLGKALELLQGTQIIGTVLNKVDKKVKAAY
jgi:protein-tyrosine kinase